MRTYKVIETMGKIARDRTSYGYQFSVDELEVEKLVMGEDLSPFENRRVRVVIFIEENEYE
jgi:hypothetical protein